MSITFSDLAVGKKFWYNSQWYTKIREREDGMNSEYGSAPKKGFVMPVYRRIEPTAIVNYKG